MRAKAGRLFALTTLLTLLYQGYAVAQAVPTRRGPPDRSWPELPGASKGKVESYWIAPLVSVSKEFGKNTVTWFAADGRVKHTAVVESIEPGFVTLHGHGSVGEEIDGTNEDWRIELPKRADDSEASIESTPDSRVFIEEYQPKPGMISIDFYLHGKLAGTAGPFLDYTGNSIELNDDGSASLLVWKDTTRKTPQVVGLNASGQVLFRVDCDEPFVDRGGAPGGVGALLLPNRGGSDRNTFRWYTGDGKLHSLDISPVPYLVGWIPKTRMSLFSTSLGDKTQNYQLIDWDTGKVVWEIPPFGEGYVLAVGITPKLIVFSVAELYKPGAWRGANWFQRNGGKEWIRGFYAVNVLDGSTVSHWRAHYPRRLDGDLRDRFLTLGERLFFLTRDEVIEINQDEIIGKENGWSK
jgi:hypothetical protein